MTDEELLQLKLDVETLRNDLASKLPTPEVIAELRATIAAIGDKIALSDRFAKLEQEHTKYVSADVALELRTSVSAAIDKLTLSERFSRIEQEHNSWKTLAKYFSITVPLLGVVLGVVLTVVGYRSFDNLVHSEVDKRFAFYSDLSTGLAYSEKYSGSAIPYLMRCFDQRPFEEPIIAALIFASDNAENWDAGQIVVERLERDPTKSARFQDPLTYNQIGVAALNVALSNPDFYPRARRALDQGLRIVTPENSNVLWSLHFNRWRYFLATDDDTRASEEVQKLKTLTPPTDTESWDKARKYKWFEVLLRVKPNIEKKTQQSYRAITRKALPTD